MYCYRILLVSLSCLLLIFVFTTGFRAKAGENIETWNYVDDTHTYWVIYHCFWDKRAFPINWCMNNNGVDQLGDQNDLARPA